MSEQRLSFLIVYGTSEGQTAKIADRMSDTLSRRGHEVEVFEAGELPEALDVAGFDAVVVGSSIHAGRHSEPVAEFVSAHRDPLGSYPTGFFQVSLSSAADDPEHRAAAAGLVETFLASNDWHPDRIGLFGGALKYSQYGFLKRLVMKTIARRAGGDVDTSRDYEYTDWEEVEQFAADFAGFVERRLGVAPPRASAQ